MQATDLPMDTEPVVKDWLIKRNCSVSPRQFVAFYVSLALFSLLIAGLLVWAGAWLVLPFTGIELLAVGIAFVMYARHAVDYERILLFHDRLLFERMDAETLAHMGFKPHWGQGEPGARPGDPVKR